MPEQPPQTQERQPGRESAMRPVPDSEPRSRGTRLAGRAAIVTGGDSGIGRAVARAFAAQGADVVIAYLDEHDDAEQTAAMVRDEGRTAVTVHGDVGSREHCREVVARAIDELGRLDVLVNNAGEQHVAHDPLDLDEQQVERTFRTNVFGTISMVVAALPHLGEGAAIVNSASVTAYKGNPVLLDYSATKGAIIAFTRALSARLAEQGVRVNAVAPGPVWTPLIPATFDEESVASFGGSVPLGRPGQPAEIAPSYVFLASDEAAFMTGQVLHPNGGTIVAG